MLRRIARRFSIKRNQASVGAFVLMIGAAVTLVVGSASAGSQGNVAPAAAPAGPAAQPGGVPIASATPDQSQIAIQPSPQPQVQDQAPVQNQDQAQVQVAPGLQRIGARIFKSLGLGRKRADWESENGNGTDDRRWKVYKNGDFRVLFVDNKIWHLRRKWKNNQAPSLAQARTTVAQRLPDDLELVKTGSLSERLFVETYYSPSLAEQFDPAAGWPGDRRPGTFLVMYHIDDDLPGKDAVVMLEIKVGNNPMSDNDQ